MRILLNGESREIPDHSSLADLVATLQLGERRFAVELNEEVVPRSCLRDQRLAPEDRVEIVHAIGGG